MAAKHDYAPSVIRLGLLKGLRSLSELEDRIAALPTPKQRGDAFEVFAEAYLATQKIVQASEVWPDQHIPIDVLAALKLPGRDHGVDGVLRTWSGNLSAYQVKFRTGRPALTWDELSTFMGLTDQVDERVLFTNCDDLAAVMNERSGFYCIRGSDLDRLTESDFQTISDWLETGQVQAKRKTPRPHQAEALDALSSGLADHDRVTGVMACATGKTLVALWLAERIGHQRLVVLVPSLALIRQTLHEWLKETIWDRPRFLCVCSDPSVAKGDDEIVVQQSELDFAVTTSPEQVRAFLSRSGDGVQVVFTTYQSSKVVGAAMTGLPGFSLGIFDEAHKTAGRDGTNFSFALRDENLEIAKRVFLTATPRHYDVRHKDEEGDAKLIYSMDAPEIYGPTVHTLSFAEAARRDIICDYKVIISVVTSDSLDDALLKHGEVIIDGDIVSARQVAHQIALQKACAEHDLRKIFTFHTRVEAASAFTGVGGQSIRSHLPDYRTFHVSGDMPTAKRGNLMTAFKEADRALISNARCLTEGVDVPAVDMVAFMSPKKSRVDIVQAIGRAMRKADHKTVGYVMVPLYVEMASGETIEEALQRTDFGDIWDVLQAMREQDDVLADLIQELKVEKGRTGSFDHNRTRERIEVLGPELSLDQLKRSIETALVDRMGSAWDERFGELQAYKLEHGHCNVPRHWPVNAQLARWVGKQRASRAKGQLATERMQWLKDLGFEWDPHSSAWDTMLDELKAFWATHGHCNVPRHWPDNPQLAKWVGKQRTARSKNQMIGARIQRLEALGFEWAPRSSEWEAMFAKLQAFSAAHGHCKVPQGWSENPQLSSWVTSQRTAKTTGALAAERIQRLEDLGFDWDPLSSAWDAMFSELQAFKKTHGHCNVPRGWTDKPSLATWVGTQRDFKSKGALAEERIQRLEKLDFDWDPLSSEWEAMFAKLQAFSSAHGHCKVPQGWSENPKLGTWVGTQRVRKTKGRLPRELIQRLEKLGFDWDPLSSAWDAMFSELQAFKKTHGHCKVPQRWSENPKLWGWVNNQRTFKLTDRLTAERIQRLEDLGFEWRPQSSTWDRMFAELRAFKETHGHCNVPGRWPENPKLGHWVTNQRSFKLTDRLTAERIQRLEDLGFEWRRSRPDQAVG